MNQTHKINWSLPDSLLPKANLLSQYSEEINKRFAGTARSFVHGIVTTGYTHQPYFSAEQLNKLNYDIWVVVKESTNGYSGNAYAGFSGDGSRVCYISFNDIYDLSILVKDINSGSPWEMATIRQIGSIIHEIGHGAGLGYGEIYKLATVEDASADQWKTNISLISPTDPFWARHPDWRNTYMLTASGTFWANYERKALESNYSLYYTNIPFTDLTNIKLKIVDNAGLPYNNANIKIWRQFKLSTSVPNIYYTAVTDSNGVISFPWAFEAEMSSDILRFIQIEFKGQLKEFWISCQESQEQAVLYGRQTWNIKFNFETGVVTFTDMNGIEEPQDPNSVEENITVSITNPKDGESFPAPAGVLLKSVATSNKSITKVEYYNGNIKLGEATSAPYFLSNSFNAGSYNFIAKAIGETGKIVASAPVSISVIATNVLNVSLTSPKSTDSYSASVSEPASVIITANVTSSSQITKVEFYNGANLLKTLTSSPYTATTVLLAGTYTFTAKAYTVSSSLTSDPVTISIKEITTTPPIDNTEIKALKDSIILLKNSITALNSKIDGIVNGSIGINIKLNK